MSDGIIKMYCWILSSAEKNLKKVVFHLLYQYDIYLSVCLPQFPHDRVIEVACVVNCHGSFLDYVFLNVEKGRTKSDTLINSPLYCASSSSFDFVFILISEK